MSYEPTVWKAGDTVTSAKLNKLEQGVAASGGASVLQVSMAHSANDGYFLDKTAGEIIEAFQNGIVLIDSEERLGLLRDISWANDTLYFDLGSVRFQASGNEDYPSMVSNE